MIYLTNILVKYISAFIKNRIVTGNNPTLIPEQDHHQTVTGNTLTLNGYIMNFDFLSDLEQKPKKPLIPEVVHRGPNTSDIKKMTRKRLIQDCLDAYEILGGIDYLVAQAQADPKEYFKIIAKLIPTNIGLDSDEITILLQDQFNNKAVIAGSDTITKLTNRTDRTNPSADRDLGSEGKESLSLPEAGAPTITDSEAAVSISVKDKF